MEVDFLSYAQISASNDKSKYEGYVFKVNIAENLHVLVKCLNNSAVFSNGEDTIKFSWCTHNEFPIASVTYINCEEGYYAGIKFLLDTAKEFETAFGAFVEHLESQ